MAVTTNLPETSRTVHSVADSGPADTPAALTHALARPQVASGRLGFEARMVQRARGRNLRADAIQRAFDIVVASVAIVVAAPLMLGVAAVVAITSRGPVIFRQTRIGRHGEPFECMKFRTMRTDAEARLAAMLLEDEGARAAFEKDFKLLADPRITRIGRLLRRSSLDELPQLIDVLRGDMSIVGPRPVVPEELGRYGSCAQVVLQVRPGMTGAWQVNGRNTTSYEQRVRLDLDYALNRSLRGDIGILRRTIRCVLKPESGEAG
jgi:lipopolysaccharide/colanic/teichoic acid biosynthesis glycosyltransferase